MQTANKPENNNNSHEANPSLGKLDDPIKIIKALLRAKKALKNAKAGTPEHAYANELNRAAWKAAREIIKR